MPAAIADVFTYGKSYIQALPRYIPGKPASSVAQQYGFAESEVLKLASNENPLGIPGSAQQAMLNLAAQASGCYPEPEAAPLKARLAERFGVPQSWITVGNGSSEILELAARAFAGQGDSIVMSEYAFALYSLYTSAVGATPVVIPARDFGHDLEAMLAAIDKTTKLIYIANPNNPTGTFIEPDEIEYFLSRVPKEVVVLLDEAYAEYLPDALQTDSAALLERHRNLILLRTFSKAYGLAGLRVGYSMAQPELTQILNQVRSAFNTNSFAQVAALAALSDEEFVRCTRDLNDRGREQLYHGFDLLALPYLRSAGNFVLVHVGDGERISEELLKRAVIVRPVSSYGLKAWVRISVGLPEQNERLLEALSSSLHSAAAYRQ
ncbi:histidinol-phosphate transaminase [Silvibacterium sp.]|uniref:histidinol-phosphate transaminase n=1 Tax=Silvibacterium sp. TaxID=1964179 RepID=UPI0039E655BD